MSTLSLYVLVFVVGPGLFLLLWYRAADPRGLALGALVASLAGPALQLFGTGWGTAIAAIGLIWLGWVLVMAAGAMIVAKAQPDYRLLCRVLGAIGTTVPWFGFVTARLLME